MCFSEPESVHACLSGVEIAAQIDSQDVHDEGLFKHVEIEYCLPVASMAVQYCSTSLLFFQERHRSCP